MEFPKPSTRQWLVPTLYGSATLLLSGVFFWLSFAYKLEFLILAFGVLVMLLPAGISLQMYFAKLKCYNKLAAVNEYFDDAEAKLFADEHKLLRDTILEKFEVAKQKLKLSDAGWDGHAMRFLEHSGAIMCTLTLDTFGQTEMTRMYYFKDPSLPVYTANDARITGPDGTVEYWRPFYDVEWMGSLNHIATAIELQELSDYLEQIIQYT